MTITPPAEPPDAGYERLLRRLDDDEARAGAAFDRLRRTLVKFFDWRGASWPEECADETIDRVARKLAEDLTVNDIPAFCHGIARMVLHEAIRADARRAPLDETAASTIEPDGPRADDALLETLDRCLDALPEGGRELVLAYYAEDGGGQRIRHRRDIARRTGLTDNALRSRVQRLRDSLEDCVRRRGEAAGHGEAARRHISPRRSTIRWRETRDAD